MRAIAFASLLAFAPLAAIAEGGGSTDLMSLQQQITALQAQQPAPCNTVPAPDTLLGSIGSGPCLPTATASRPTAVQAALVTTASDGTWSVTWARPFASATPYINPQPVNPSALQPVICNVTSSTATGATGKCWMQAALALPGVAVNLLNLQFVGAAASMQIRVAGRDLTQ